MTDTTNDEVDRLALSARAAFDSIVATPESVRAAWLRAVADTLDAHLYELVPLAAEETALGTPRLSGEVARTTAQLRMFADAVEEGGYLEAIIDHADPTATPLRPDLRRLLRPLGPVAVFAASNFPFAFSVAGGDTAAALAAGCPVLVKAHPGHRRLSARTATLVAEALREAKAPDEVFALVEGYDAGLRLVEHPAVRAVAFTGSVAGGRALHERSAMREDPIPFYGELGSLNPVVVTRAADVARGAQLAEGLAASFQLGTGQFCTKPGLVLVPEDSVIESALPDQVGGTPHRLLTGAIADAFHERLARVAGTPGVTVIVDARGGGDDPGQGHAGPVVAATDAATLRDHAGTLLDEVFGPFTLLVRYHDQADLIETLARVTGSLTATLHAEPDDDVGAVVRRLEELAGRVLFSGWPTGVAVTWAQHHGGPWPSTTTQFTSVGPTAIRRFQRPIAYQDAPAGLLPAALREDNPLGIPRRVDGTIVLPD